MVDPPKDLSHHDWPWLIATLMVSAVLFLASSTWFTLSCMGPLNGRGGCWATHFGILLLTILSLIAIVGSSVQLARLHPHLRSKHVPKHR